MRGPRALPDGVFWLFGRAAVVTTQQAKLAQKLGDVIASFAARTLLRESAGIEPETPMPPAADGIIKECGRLPLAISSVGALIKVGRFDWQQVWRG